MFDLLSLLLRFLFRVLCLLQLVPDEEEGRQKGDNR
jgi:hypothetical protein